jgi:hypothetical protein
VEGAYAIIDLAGESVASGPWTQSKRDSIMQSRTNSATAVVDAVSGARDKPKVVVQASAVGYYGSRGDELLDEETDPGNGFLADVCKRTESIASRVERSGVRPVLLRTGLVLGREGGILPRFMTPYRFFAGGYVGSGRQWLPWITLRDEVRAIRFLVEHEDQRGAFNLVSPNPVTMKQFARELGRVLGRPAWTWLPAFALRLALGRMADETLLVSERVVPTRLRDAGFSFQDPDLKNALEMILRGEEA